MLAVHVVPAGSTSGGIAQAALTLVDSLGNITTATTDSTGAYSFADLAAGLYSLQAAAPGYVVAVAALSVPVTTFTMQLAKEGSLPVSTLTVTIAGPATLAVGASAQLTASVVYTDGTRKDVTSVAAWKSTASSVAAVSSTGLMTAYSPGAATITASFQDVSGSMDVSTTSP